MTKVLHIDLDPAVADSTLRRGTERARRGSWTFTTARRDLRPAGEGEAGLLLTAVTCSAIRPMARVDLKADSTERRLLVPAAYTEPDAGPKCAPTRAHRCPRCRAADDPGLAGS